MAASEGLYTSDVPRIMVGKFNYSLTLDLNFDILWLKLYIFI